MKYVFLIIATFFICSCALMSEVKNIGLKNNLDRHIGMNETELFKLIGPPIFETKSMSDEKILYYRQRWYISKSGQIIDAAFFKNNEFKISLKSIFNDDFRNSISGKTFAIHSGMTNIKDNDLEFKQHSAALAHIFKLNNLSVVKENSEKTNYIILMSYGIGDPIEDIYVKYIPTFQWVPGQTYSSTGNFGNSNFNSTTTSSGYLQNTGYVPKVNKEITFKRFLVINVYENSKDLASATQIWKVSMESIGFSDELKPVLGSMFGILQERLFKTSDNKEVFFRPINDPMTIFSFK